MVGRIIAWIFFGLAVVAAGRDGFVFLGTGTYNPVTLGEIWYGVDRGSLNLVQAVIERYIHPFLWTDVLFPLLLWPAWAVLTGFAVVVALVSGGRRRRKWRSGSLG
jgi:hypothetical protein